MAGQDSSWGGRLAVEEISRNGQMVQRPVWHLTGDFEAVAGDIGRQEAGEWG